MRYIPHTPEDVDRMLHAVGAESVDDLFKMIPEPLRLRSPLDLPAAASESEVLGELRALAHRNISPETHRWFLGAGTYAHFSPSVVDAIASRAEFFTAYTPYQAEISQGTLQVMYEWQTMVCGLTGLEVSNASLYDGASAAAEAALMAMRITRRNRIVVGGGIHPHTHDVLRTIVGGLDCEVVDAERASDGRSAELGPWIDDETACVILPQPGFLGSLNDVAAAAEAAHAHGALLVVVIGEALCLALLQAPGTDGADIVCGEAQSFGVPMAYGGPHLGFLATRQKFVRQLPGRLAGETQDSRGKRGFVLTLATREQHIRRERATSNICTNQGLCLLMATVYLSLLGPVGLRRLAATNLAKAEYAKARIRETPGLSLPLTAPTFNEFVVGLSRPAEEALADCLERGIVGGLDLASCAPELGPAVLVCTTEVVGREDIDRLVALLAGRSS